MRTVIALALFAGTFVAPRWVGPLNLPVTLLSAAVILAVWQASRV